jgi:hypothetical protein
MIINLSLLPPLFYLHFNLTSKELSTTRLVLLVFVGDSVSAEMVGMSSPSLVVSLVPYVGVRSGHGILTGFHQREQKIR